MPSRALQIAPLALVLAAFPAAAGASPAVSVTDWGNFGIRIDAMDPAVRPGDDFDGYVNGTWNRTTEIAPDKTRTGAFMDLRDLSDERMHAVMTDLASRPQPPGSAEARLAAAWTAYMNTGAIEAAGLAPARPWLDRIASARTTRDIVRLFGEPGLASPLTAEVYADAKNSGVYALHLSQGGLGLPDRDYYLSDDPKHKAMRAQYRDYVAYLLAQASIANPKTRAEEVLALETAMAHAMWDRAVKRNVDLTYNRVERIDLEALDAAGLMRGFLGALGADTASYAIVSEIPPTPVELARAGISADPLKIGGGVPATLALIRSTPVSTWKAYLAARFLSDNAQFLPRAIDEATFALYGQALAGQKQQKDRWRRGITAVEGQIGELAGRIYAERYFPPANKAAMQQLVANLRTAMAANLADLSWMGPQTRTEALAKLAAFTPKIGYPDQYKSYEGLELGAATPLANQIAAIRWMKEFDTARIGKPVDRSEWGMLPQTVNAYYNRTANEIVFPAAILQPPFFNLSADPAVNYGAIGAVIGHEMGHGFDDQGAKADGSGNLRDWWTPEDTANFRKLQDRLAEQYSRFCPFDGGKTCVNGQLTMGENIGDLGGLSLAYRAYRLSLGGKEAPVIDGFTGDQRFFLAWAQVWRSKVREELARQFLVIDPHAPPQYRVNGVVRNFDQWYRAFGVKPGDALYLPPEERVRIW